MDEPNQMVDGASISIPLSDIPEAHPDLEISLTKTKLKRPIEAIENTVPTPSPQETELARLEKVLENAQIERRTLLRQIQEMLAEQDRPAHLPSRSEDDQESEHEQSRNQTEAGAIHSSTRLQGVSTGEVLPSTAAHSSPPPPLTPAEEAETTSRAHGVIKEHIRLLSKYNEIRDIGQGLIGMVADNRRVRIRDCQEEFGVGDDD